MKKSFVLILVAILSMGCVKASKNVAATAPSKSTASTAAAKSVSTPSITEMSENELPDGAKVKKTEGKLFKAVKWTDKAGENLLVMTETGTWNSPRIKHDSPDCIDAELFVYHYIITDGKPVQDWKIYDLASDCEVSVQANFVRGAFSVTDLDGDGISEVWIMYQLAAHGDVSAIPMKLIMHEGADKFAMRGRNQIFVDGSNQGGEFTFDKAFNAAPQAFRDNAKALWNKYLKYNIEAEITQPDEK